LILRANAGDCINITLENRVPDVALNIGSSSSGIPINTSHEVGLHPQLVAFDVTRSDGVNVGKNPPLTIKPNQNGPYTWYAGNIEVDSVGNVQHIPVEFGSIPLTPSDPLMQHPFGLVGALIIEPQGTSWRTDDNARASATVCKGTGGCKDGDILFREFVAVVQDDVSSIRQTTSTPGPPPKAISIVGTVLNGKVAWAINNQSLPAGGVALTRGQTVTFDIGSGTHGLLFNDEASARAVFDIDGSPDKAKFQTFALQCGMANSFGTGPQSSGHIATLTAKQTVTLTALPFVCSQHCQNMPGSFTLGLPPTEDTPGCRPDSPGLCNTRAINYRTEPLGYRFVDSLWLENFNNSPIGVSRALSNSLVLADPQTPVFAATAKTPLRFRMVHPAGINEQVFTLHGHVWQEEPYVNGSKEIGHNPLSQSQGSRDGFGANVSFDAVIDEAGGAAGVPGDYLYRTFIGNVFQNGMWGVLRVAAPTQDIVTITRFSNPKLTKGKVLITGTTTVDPNTGRMTDGVTIFDTTGGTRKELGQAEVDKLTGAWPKSGQPFRAPATVTSILVRSANNGETVAASYIPEEPRLPSAAAMAARVTAARKREPQRADELALFNAVPKPTGTLIEASGREPDQAGWLLNGQPLGTDRTIVVRPGNTITISVKDGQHDLTFPNASLAKSVFQFQMPGSAFTAKDRAISTGAIQGGVLATLTVRGDIAAGVTRVPFTSTIDGRRMDATFVIGR